MDFWQQKFNCCFHVPSPVVFASPEVPPSVIRRATAWPRAPSLASSATMWQTRSCVTHRGSGQGCTLTQSNFSAKPLLHSPVPPVRALAGRLDWYARQEGDPRYPRHIGLAPHLHLCPTLPVCGPLPQLGCKVWAAVGIAGTVQIDLAAAQVSLTSRTMSSANESCQIVLFVTTIVQRL